ncbi:MAG: hypothetical protein ABL931_13490, partial [Usitatibacteraceae bacterium]
AEQSLAYLLASGIYYEVRTTRHPNLISDGQLETMTTSLCDAGVRYFALQEFRPHGCNDLTLESQPLPLADAHIAALQRKFPTFILRRAN